MCRFQRLANSSGKVALADFQLLPELQGSLFAPRIFQLFDADADGALDQQEFTAAVEALGRLQTEEDKAACAPPASFLLPCHWMAPLHTCMQFLQFYGFGGNEAGGRQGTDAHECTCWVQSPSGCMIWTGTAS